MLEAIAGGNDIPRKALRKVKIDSIEEYAKAVATNLSGEFSALPASAQAVADLQPSKHWFGLAVRLTHSYVCNMNSD